MLYDSNLARYLALCRKNDIPPEGAHYIAFISGYNLKSPEHVALWASVHSQRIDTELAMLPNDMHPDDAELEMEKALATCKDNLRDILWFAPADGAPIGQNSLEQTEAPRSEHGPAMTQ